MIFKKTKYKVVDRLVWNVDRTKNIEKMVNGIIKFHHSMRRRSLKVCFGDLKRYGVRMLMLKKCARPKIDLIVKSKVKCYLQFFFKKIKRRQAESKNMNKESIVSSKNKAVIHISSEKVSKVFDSIINSQVSIF